MNVIVNAFAFKKEYGNSLQISKKSDDEKLAIYMKNIVVSMISAKRVNPDDDVMVVTNSPICEPFNSMLTEHGILLKVIPFDKYEMPQKFLWSLAFFKLNVLDFLANETDYERILLIDNDTFCSRNFSDIWNEVDYGLMMCPVNHAYSHEERRKIRVDYENLYPDEHNNLVHYGGEFICAKRDNLITFMNMCSEVYKTIVASDFNVVDNIGDETIISIAAIHYKKENPFFESGAYLFRYWTEKRFYLASTNWSANPVCIWHVPSEKDRGMLLLYNYFIKHGQLPDIEKSAKMLALPKVARPLNYLTLKGRALRYFSNKK